MSASLYVAIQSFAITDGAQVVRVKRGDLLRAGHPLLAAHPEMFESAATYRPEIERTTAVPGEKR